MPVPRRRRKKDEAGEPAEAEGTQEETADGESGEEKSAAAKPKRARAKASKKKAEAAAEESPEAKAEDDGPKAKATAEADAAETAGEGGDDRPEAEATDAPAPEAEAEPAAAAEAGPDAAAHADEPTDADGEDDDVDGDDDDAESEQQPKSSERPRRGAAETTTRREPARPAPRRESDGAVQVRAQAKYVRSAPRKARLVMDHIRGKDVSDARAILRHTPRAAATDIAKLLDSAVANAENNFELDPDDLKIDRAFVDEGPTIKRYRPRALGWAKRIDKRTSNMTITLTMRAGAGDNGGGRR